jgi:FixJ family two-component response regulator
VTSTRPLVAVVDDDMSVRRALARLLRAAGYHTETFADAEAFLAHPASHPPACLILDVRMPGMSGHELYDHLIAEHRPIPTIFITGHGDSTMAARAIKAGAAGFLLKPFEDEQLLEAVRGAVGGSEVRGERGI